MNDVGGEGWIERAISWGWLGLFFDRGFGMEAGSFFKKLKITGGQDILKANNSRLMDI